MENWLKFGIKLLSFKKGTDASEATRLLHESDWNNMLTFGFLCSQFASERAMGEWFAMLNMRAFDLNDNIPQLYQNDDNDLYNGQPVVWDGVFEYCTQINQVRYVGHTEPSGEGDYVSRVLMPTDWVYWESCEPLYNYIK